MKLTYSKTHSPVQIRFNLPSSVEKHYTAKHILASAVKNAFERKKAQCKFASTSKKRMRSCHHPNLLRRNTMLRAPVRVRPSWNPWNDISLETIDRVAPVIANHCPAGD
ncbi:hypothetical protein [Rhizobium mongolense]|uniref:hypothetical protein n=1 Tax=Rhizobium mongolense TaxID=57676 RepID=UPI00119F6185|nr:hypothetical protein [Rhizobium mongolense]